MRRFGDDRFGCRGRFVLRERALRDASFAEQKTTNTSALIQRSGERGGTKKVLDRG